MNKINKTGITGLLLVILISSSCRKLVETDPPTDRLTGTNVFLADGTAIAVFNGIYRTMKDFQGNDGVSLRTGLSADELKLFSNVNDFASQSYYRNDLVSRQGGGTTTYGGEFWARFYYHIYKCNDAIDGLNKSTK